MLSKMTVDVLLQCCVCNNVCRWQFILGRMQIVPRGHSRLTFCGWQISERRWKI